MCNNRKNNETYSKIIDVTLELLCQKGCCGVSIREITKKVDINKSTLYDHFKSKDDLILASVVHVLEYCRQFVFPMSSALDSSDKIKIFYRTLDNYFTNHHSYHVVMLLLALELRHDDHPQIYRKINDYFSEWKVLFFHVLASSSSQHSINFIGDSAKNCFAQLIGNFFLNYIENKKGVNEFPKSWKELVDYCIQQTCYMKSLKQQHEDNKNE